MTKDNAIKNKDMNDKMNDTMKEDKMNDTMKEDKMNDTMKEDKMNDTMKEDKMNDTIKEDKMKDDEFYFSKEMQKDFAKAFKDRSGGNKKEKKLEELKNAARHFQAGHYGKAQRTLDMLSKQAPYIPEILELSGLCHYRLGDFQEAIDYLEEFSRQTESMEQYPVMADCYRGLQDYKKVEELWKLLDKGSQEDVSLEQKIEGRIVYAGALADQEKMESAAKILRAAVGNEERLPNKPNFIEIKQVYTLADIYDQSGAFEKAKRLFEWVVEKDRYDETDASQRLSLMS